MKAHKSSIGIAVLVFSLLMASAQSLAAQTANDELRKRAFDLYDKNNMVDAVPLLEKLNADNPADVVVLERLAFATFVSASAATDESERQRIRDRARALAVRARDMGDNSNLLRVVLESSPDGGQKFSDRQEVDAVMREGESAFAKGDLKGALAAYDRVLSLDPNNYEAALFTGDVYFKQKQMETAGQWFARATSINPDRETAYRYWGDALMGDGKVEEARTKFVDAIVAEPYNRNALAGLSQWGSRTRTPLAHPRIESPVNSVRRTSDGKVDVVVNPAAAGNAEDGTDAWTDYSIIRAAWMSKGFAQAFPEEKNYRHSLAEEAGALRAVAERISGNLKEGKLKKEQLNVSIANLVKVYDAGLLEAYVLLARPDAGIAQDYPKYRQDHRDELRRYLTELVIGAR
jgi:tetratricopeptide (TPR) repeat protein